MNLSAKLQKSVGAFRWADVQDHLAGVPQAKLHQEIETILNVILRDGYLILRRPEPEKAARRDSFLAAFRKCAADHGAEALFAARASQLDGARLTEMAYQELISSVRADVLSRLPPDVFLWAVLRECELQTRDIIAAMQSLPPDTAFLDPVAGRIPVESAGGDVNPDQLIDSIMRTLTATIKMLAYEQGWFAADNIIDIPPPALTEALPQEIVRANHFLAEAWSQLERSEGRCRYFGGRVTEERIADTESDRSMKLIRFDSPDAGEVGMHIAGERVKRMFVSFSRDVDKNPGIQAKLALPEPIPLAPDGFVSLSEAHGAIALSHVLFKWIGEVKEEYGGLTIVEWLRGYALLQKLGTSHLQESPREVYAMYTPRLLEDMLRRASLTAEKAKTFIGNVLFGKNAADVFDSPLLRCANGNLFLVAPAAAGYHPAFVIMSRLASLRCDLSWKGKTFEKDIVKLFQNQGIPAAAIHRTIDGQECEVDCVVLWGGILFILECKNYSLPGDSPQVEYWFASDQASAARQARTKADILGRHPEVIEKDLGVKPEWKQVVPVVLNGTPYSLNGPIDGVYFYDASALTRFFEKRHIGVQIGDAPVSATTVSLWAGERPSTDDLLKQLASPAQVALFGEHYARTATTFPVSRTLAVSTVKIDRSPHDPD